MSKCFSRSLYEQYNDHGIQVAMSFLLQLGYKTINTDEAFKSHDFIVEKDDKKYLIEAEVTEKWENVQFPYSQMSVPFRKAQSNADFYVRVNKAGNALFFMPMRDVLKAPVIVKNTCYTKNEKFFNLPVSALKLYYKEDGVWYVDEDDLFAVSH